MLVSARFWEGNELKVLRMCQAGHLVSVTSPDILDELAGVMASKFGTKVGDIDTFREEIELVSELVLPDGVLEVIDIDPSDDIVLETAVIGEVDLIVSGDGHLLSLGTFRGVKIVWATDLVRLTGSR